MVKTFRSLKDLEKYINSSQGQGKFLNEAQIRNMLTEAGRTLEKYLREELQKWFSSYDPVEYTRTGYTLESFRVGEPKKISINEWSLEITFFEGLANHPSYIDDSQPDGYTPWLLHAGWRTKLDSKLNKENFTRFKGTNYITKAVERFNRNNPHNLKIQIFYGNKDVTDKTYSYGK